MRKSTVSKKRNRKTMFYQKKFNFKNVIHLFNG